MGSSRVRSSEKQLTGVRWVGVYGFICRCTLVKAKFCMHKQKLQKTILEMVCTFSQVEKLKIICTCLLHTAATDGLAIHPQLPVLQVKWFFNLVTNSCSSCCGCCWIIIIIIIIIISWREKGCGLLSLQISPILITVGPGFLQQRKEILGLASKKIINQSIHQSINQLCSRSVKRIEFMDSLRFFFLFFFLMSFRQD